MLDYLVWQSTIHCTSKYKPLVRHTTLQTNCTSFSAYDIILYIGIVFPANIFWTKYSDGIFDRFFFCLFLCLLRENISGSWNWNSVFGVRSVSWKYSRTTCFIELPIFAWLRIFYYKIRTSKFSLAWAYVIRCQK